MIATPAGIFLAVLLDRELPGSQILQSIFFLPVMFSLALIGVIWQLMFSPDQGLINGVFGTDIDWFGNSNINLWAALVAASWKHIGYIMILYLAGLKGVDPSLKEAAAIDGANGRQTFFRVVFPAMRPINIVIVVITVIEALRAFDIVWIINKGTNGLQLLSTLIVTRTAAPRPRVGYASALAVILLVVALVPIISLPVPGLQGGEPMTATTADAGPRREPRPPGAERQAGAPTSPLNRGSRGRPDRHPDLS